MKRYTVLGIMGSPRRHGNTEILLDSALSGAQQANAEVSKLVVTEMNISPCRELYTCTKNGSCAIQDDMQKIYKDLEAVDHVIFASPIFFYGITAQAKALVDRCQALWARRYVLHMDSNDDRVRRGAFISVGATRGKQLFTGAELTVKYFYTSLGIKYYCSLFIDGIDAKAEVNKHPTAIQDAFSLGERLVAQEEDTKWN